MLLFRRMNVAKAFASLPDNLCQICLSCKQIIFTKELEKNLMVCPKCGYHYRLTAAQRIDQVCDSGSFQQINADLVSLDPLAFPEYREKLGKGAKTGLHDSMVTGVGFIDEIRAVLGVADFRFMGGSMGSVAGEKIVRAMELAIEEKLPVILFTASGGARMQEGLISLMQMPKTCAAAARLKAAGLPYVVIFTDPTMAGVFASYASVGHYVLAEPKAKVGFAGPRVGHKEDGQAKQVSFQTSEFHNQHGMVDLVVARKDIRSTLSLVLQVSGCDKEAALE